VKVQSITILGKECNVADEVRVQNCVCLPYKELKRVSSCSVMSNIRRFTDHVRFHRTYKTKLSCRMLSIFDYCSIHMQHHRHAEPVVTVGPFSAVQLFTS
jgi:hypothetical protein